MNATTLRSLRALALIAALAAAFALGFALRGGDDQRHTAATASADAQAATTWTCSMHPQIQLDEFGACPICGMDLIPLANDAQETTGPRSLSLSPAARALAEIRTTAVVRRPVTTTLRLVGKLEADESRIREISAWVDGRIERLYIDHTGVRVQAGQKLFQLYSPALFSAQEELLQAKKAEAQLQQSHLESTRRSAARTVVAARERLRLWGLTSEQIAAIEAAGVASERVNIVAPISGTVLHKAAVEGGYVQTGTHVYDIADLDVLWLKLDVYEADLAWIREGQRVSFNTDAYAGETFEGVVSFIDPVLDPRSRSVKVRVDVQNADGRLKPGLFARALVHVSITDDAGNPPLVIPRTAPLMTGTRAIVYVAAPGDASQFTGREVVLGREAGDLVVVEEGLVEGERVVSHGSFKIDSALQIQARTSMMNPETTTPQVMRPAVPEALQDALDGIHAGYLDISKALSHDDLATAQSAAGALQSRLAPAVAAATSGDTAEALQDFQRRSQTSLQALQRSEDLVAARVAFYDLSKAVINLVRLYGGSGVRALHLYHCPMADAGAGADWLQDFEGTENPYFGSQMFRCGSQTETLIDGAAAAPEDTP